MTPSLLRAGPMRVSASSDMVRAFRRETYKKVVGYNKDRKILDDSELVMKVKERSS